MLVLASGSPRRKELIRRLTANFSSAASQVESVGSSLLPDWPVEPLPLPPDFQIRPEDHPTLWAWRKAVDVFATLPDTQARATILGADTVVIGHGALLGKPKSEGEALAMLKTLRGKEHFVATGFALLETHASHVELASAGAVVSTVWMRDSSDDELAGYVASGEPRDKAGAYAVQGLGGALVERVEGCYFNVVGLPLCSVREALEKGGVELLPYPAGGYCDFCPLRRTATRS
jgi:septum formation protein